MIVQASLRPISRTALSSPPITTRAAIPAWTGATTARFPANWAAVASSLMRQKLLTETEGPTAVLPPVTMVSRRQPLSAHRLLPALRFPAIPANPELRELVKVLRTNGLIRARVAALAKRARPRELSTIRRSAAL